MNERDDFLWDRSGEADAELQKLEQLFAPLAHDGRELPLDALPEQLPAQPTKHPVRRWPWLLAAAALLAIAFGMFYETGDGPLSEGAAAREFVATDKPLRIDLGQLADVTLAPGARLRFEHWRKDQALFRLEQGSLSARVAPFPAVQAGFFQIDTKLGRVIDQGCRYELDVGDDGNASVRVTEGAVTFAFPQRTVFVPAGASTFVTQRGPSTPVFVGTEPELRKAVQFCDDLIQKGDTTMRSKGVAMVVDLCREPRDSLVLWHLLRDDDPVLREQAERALLDLVGPPEPQTKGGMDRWDPEVWLAFLRLGAWIQAK